MMHLIYKHDKSVFSMTVLPGVDMLFKIMKVEAIENLEDSYPLGGLPIDFVLMPVVESLGGWSEEAQLLG